MHKLNERRKSRTINLIYIFVFNNIHVCVQSYTYFYFTIYILSFFISYNKLDYNSTPTVVKSTKIKLKNPKKIQSYNR